MIFHVKDQDDNLVAVVDNTFRNGWYLEHYRNEGYNIVPVNGD
ncbi:hypothetical protein MarbSA_14180 [Methanobrevibacter arboriphilus]|uniref:Uncharacterized protein n=1 Tax=Methanobrevibacter arboriphilus TaxID=39441 RepID=A0ACA8R6A1_METAZ|nr:hypothetical protein MarbSA_14180 [Methanobrevibacter arboriphilus]